MKQKFILPVYRNLKNDLQPGVRCIAVDPTLQRLSKEGQGLMLAWANRVTIPQREKRNLLI